MNEITNSDTIHAPWTADQVAVLNEYQQAGVFHPYTCGRRDYHAESRTDDTLIATADGWCCPDPDCGYTQDWVLAFLANRDESGRTYIQQYRATVIEGNF